MADKPVYITTELLNFLAHMPTDNALELIVLKGHLLIEQLLEEIIRHVVAHGDLLDDVQINFHTKAKLAQAMCWSQHNNATWEFILALNALRNDMAHSLGNVKSEARLQKVLVMHEATLLADERDKVAQMDTPGKLKHGVVQTMGFLGSFAGDAQMYRHRIDREFEWRSKLPPPDEKQ